MKNLQTFKSFINEAASIEKGPDGMYHPKDREGLESILNQLIKERGNEGDFNDIDTSAITDMNGLFYRNWDFNGNISKWDVSNVTNMRGMFEFATSFNQPIGNWNVSKVTDMSHMFERAESFNQDISKWNTDNITSKVYSMFEKCPIKDEYKCIFTKIKNEIPEDDDDDEGSMSDQELKDLFSKKVYGEMEEDPDPVVLNAKTDVFCDEGDIDFDKWMDKLISTVTDRYGDDFTEEEMKKAVYADKEFLDDLKSEYESCKEACEENDEDY